jgi:hypothetical protein
MIRRSLIVDPATRRSVVVHVEACDGCGTPFASCDRSGLRPIDLRSRLPRSRLAQLSTYALDCSCGRVFLVVRTEDGDLSLVPPEWITPLGAAN